jgi:hypothetical protein
MKKAIIIFLLITTILALWTFDNSFTASSGGGSTTGTSAVIFAKADYLSVRVNFIIIPKAGTWINITLPDGTRERVATSYHYNILLPKTGGVPTNLFASLPGNLTINNAKLSGATVVSDTTASTFNSLESFSSDSVSVFWIKVEGNARVTVSSYGVGV